MIRALFIVVMAAFVQDSQRTVWDGVYTEAQAERGHAIFVEKCSNCHGSEMAGADMTPPLSGGSFLANWNGLSLGDLADRIRNTMPADSPGSVSRQDTVDVMTYILRFNQFPAGKEELPREVPVLKQILFKAAKP